MLFTTPAVLWVLFFISVELRLTRSTAFGSCRPKNSPQDCFINGLTVHKEIIKSYQYSKASLYCGAFVFLLKFAKLGFDYLAELRLAKPQDFAMSG